MGPEPVCLVRGGGDLATGVVWRLHRQGYRVVVTELATPLTVRRLVSVSTAVLEGTAVVEGMTAQRANADAGALEILRNGDVAVLVDDGLPDVGASVVVDARVAKRNIDTSIGDAELVIALGPGFVAGVDAHAVIETARGPRLGRCLWEGSATPDTGTPGLIEGWGAERVVRAPADGTVEWQVDIGAWVEHGEVFGSVDGQLIRAPFPGRVRGLIHPSTPVRAGLKIGDIDPRSDVAADEISDKALAVAGGVMEAVGTWRRSH